MLEATAVTMGDSVNQYLTFNILICLVGPIVLQSPGVKLYTEECGIHTIIKWLVHGTIDGGLYC